jgi:uncharacterized membrane protein YvbJ
MFCKRCGYDLKRNSDETRSCPECGFYYHPRVVHSYAERFSQTYAGRKKNSLLMLLVLLSIAGLGYAVLHFISSTIPGKAILILLVIVFISLLNHFMDIFFERRPKDNEPILRD